jgi:hypothetical protein
VKFGTYIYVDSLEQNAAEALKAGGACSVDSCSETWNECRLGEAIFVFPEKSPSQASDPSRSTVESRPMRSLSGDLGFGDYMKVGYPEITFGLPVIREQSRSRLERLSHSRLLGEPASKPLVRTRPQ